MERIRKALDDLDLHYKIDEQSNTVLIEFWTDTAGQDVPVEMDFDGTPEGFVKEFKKRAEEYDPFEEFEIYHAMLGKRGVPDSAYTLLRDCQEAKATLIKIAGKLKQAISDSKKENVNLGTFSVDVQMQENGLYDVYIAHEGSSGEHYADVTVDRIGELLAGDIECIAEAYQA